MTKDRFAGLEPTIESQRRRQLMRAVVECVSEEGFEKTTMKKVAQRAGVSTGMLVYYFENKKDLVNAAMLEAFNNSTARINENTSSSFGSERLEILLEQYFLNQDPELPSRNFMLQVRAASLTEPELRAQIRVSHQTSRSKLRRSVMACIEAGLFRQDIDPDLAADLIFGLMIGWSTEMAVCPEEIEPEYAMRIARLALNLLAPNSGPSSKHQRHRDYDRPTLQDEPSSALEDRIRRELLAGGQIREDAAIGLAKAFAMICSATVDCSNS